MWESRSLPLAVLIRIGAIKEKLAVSECEDERQWVEKEIDGWTLKLNLLADR